MKTNTLLACTLLTGVALGLSPLPALAAEKEHGKMAAGEKGMEPMGKNMDETFAMKAADGGMTEVMAGELARKNGASQTVKDFGARMVADHSKANDELKSVAGKKNMMLPDKVSPKHQAMLDRLGKLNGEEFDKTYMSDMMKDHDADVALFTRASKEVKDPDLRAFAEKTLPVVKTHREMLMKDMGGRMTEKK